MKLLSNKHKQYVHLTSVNSARTIANKYSFIREAVHAMFQEDALSRNRRKNGQETEPKRKGRSRRSAPRIRRTAAKDLPVGIPRRQARQA